ncbi:MAG: Asp23/Gls24 family envelope stress response protein [Firmicutes bacterium]|nr:Asp23/Gls24 family envelope stress response protein [Bacillota bacterium]
MLYKASMIKAGNTLYGRKVIDSIVILATKEIDGVAGLYGRGFRTEYIDKTVNVDTYIKVYSDINCPDIAFKIQENIRRNIDTMSSFKTGEINVNILEVVIREAVKEVEPSEEATRAVDKGNEKCVCSQNGSPCAGSSESENE